MFKLREFKSAEREPSLIEGCPVLLNDRCWIHLTAGWVFRQRGFDIKWIDDSHALGLFSSPVAGE